MDRQNLTPYPAGKELETAIQNGIKSGCFYSYILSSVDRRIDETAEVVAHVSLCPHRAEWTLVVNPILFTEILEAHPDIDRESILRAILLHEYLHIAHDHFERGFALQEKYSLIERNIAADLAVNSTLEESDKNALKEIGGLFPAQPPFNFPEGLSMEQYLALLSLGSFDAKISDSKLAGYAKTMKELQAFSDALTQTAGSESVSLKDLEAFASQKLKARVRASVKNLKEKPLPGLCLPPGIGAGQMNWMVEWAYPKAKISWKHLLKDHLEHSGASGARVRTYLRSHPREGGGILLKGKTPLKMEQILILLDTSSSMRKEDYNQFIGVIKSLRSERRSFSIMQWDTARQSEPVPVERFMRLEKPRLRGGGGTNMRAGVLEASKRYPQFKRIIVVTDGHTPYFTKMNPSPVPVIWALTSNARFANADGAVIRLYSK
ncbi:MAG TPA: VWA-like domain-containing protein [Thermotogota bacterium]|jgi:hypothetical protein|nr:hypothetical protein [Thermotogota bacterium]NLH19091.1 hypothetical protein [Thermotogaceae bacterium]OQC32146.1 MAG: hypothetical protein BWX67_00567 [Thermotogota bacterium ADurb.Bin062]HNW46859.1 VWA-like domain-containing protein [Thermotogota bacterium]HNY82486.1 VWA-like domain-containing protein [Thermotogota bacterium]